MACLEYVNKVQVSMQSLKETCEKRIKEIMTEKMQRESKEETKQVKRFKVPKSVLRASEDAINIVNKFVEQEQKWNASVSIDKRKPSPSPKAALGASQAKRASPSPRSLQIRKTSPTISQLG